MSASGDSEARLSSARTYFEEAQEYESFGRAFVTILSGIILAIGSALVAFTEATVAFITRLVDAFGLGGVAWIEAFTNAPASFIASSFTSAAASLRSGAWSELGPFLPWVAAIVAIGVVGIVTWYLDRRDSDVPGLGLDIPIIGNDEDGDPSDET